MSTRKITPDTVLPQPCWIYDSVLGAWIWAEVEFWASRLEYSNADSDYTHYSTNPPDQMPEDVLEAPSIPGRYPDGIYNEAQPQATPIPSEHVMTPEEHQATDKFFMSHFTNTPAPDSLQAVAEKAAIEIARTFYGYWEGGSAGPNEAIAYFDTHKDSGEIQHLIHDRALPVIAPMLARQDEELKRVREERDNYKRSVENAHEAVDRSGLIQERAKSHQGLTPRIKSLCARLATLEQELREAREDRADLDWLEKLITESGYEVILRSGYRFQSNGVLIRTGVGSGPFEEKYEGPSAYEPLRAAIRAARKGEKEGKV